MVYPVLSGQPDLYRAFMCQVWRRGSPAGISTLIHLESHFTDDKATSLRRETYRHLRRHWQFINELHLFEIQNQKIYGVNVYGAPREVSFLHATSLYHPDTVLSSLRHDGSGDEPGLKDPSGSWDTRSHAARIQCITEQSLVAWSDALGATEASTTPMLYTINTPANRTLERLSSSQRVASLHLEYSAGWHERADRERGRFVTDWGRTNSWNGAILQGSHLFVGNPFNKWPNHTLKNHRDWTPIDLEALAPDALPVTAYKPAGDRVAYDANYTHWGDARTPARDHYRVAWRCMAANTGERTLIPAIIPPGAAHVDGIFSAGLPGGDLRTLVTVQAVASSLLADFYVRSAPKSTIRARTFNRLPMLPLEHPLLPRVILRTLRLNCVTEPYANLWAECWDEAFLEDNPILPRFDERPIGPNWTPDTPLRRAADRRNAQVEIDAMVAIMLGVPIEDLCTIYRTQFAVLYGYDHREYTYDANGRLVPNKVLAEWRKRGEPQEPSRMPEPDRTATHPGSGTTYAYVPPFVAHKRADNFHGVADQMAREGYL